MEHPLDRRRWRLDVCICRAICWRSGSLEGMAQGAWAGRGQLGRGPLGPGQPGERGSEGGGSAGVLARSGQPGWIAMRPG